MNARISRVKKDNAVELCVHAGKASGSGFKPLCGGGRDGRTIESWQLVEMKQIDCIRCMKIIVSLAKKAGVL